MFLKSNLINVNKEVSVNSGNLVFLVCFPRGVEELPLGKMNNSLFNTLIPGNSRGLSHLYLQGIPNAWSRVISGLLSYSQSP